jgi:hypothetical protein
MEAEERMSDYLPEGLSRKQGVSEEKLKEVAPNLHAEVKRLFEENSYTNIHGLIIHNDRVGDKIRVFCKHPKMKYEFNSRHFPWPDNHYEGAKYQNMTPQELAKYALENN